VDSLKFNASSDLSAAAIGVCDSSTSPPVSPLRFQREGSRSARPSTWGARNVNARRPRDESDEHQSAAEPRRLAVDTNRFDLASLAKVIPALAKYSLDGKSEIHSNVNHRGGKPSAHGTVTLADVGLSQPDQKTPPISHLSGNIKIAGTSADVGSVDV